MSEDENASLITCCDMDWPREEYLNSILVKKFKNFCLFLLSAKLKEKLLYFLELSKREKGFTVPGNHITCNRSATAGVV